MTETIDTPAVALEPRMKVRRFTTKLSTKLNVDERAARGGELAAVLDDIRNEASSQESEKREMKARLAALEAERDRLSAVVSRGAEQRDVEVEERQDYVAGKFLRVRMDTGEVTFERLLTDEEKQVEIPLDVVPAPPGS